VAIVTNRETNEDHAEAPEAVRKLVERFAEHADSYRSGSSGSYNETQIRREFIDPLFKALGWDIDNTAGHAEAYKDVIHEDAIRIGGATKAPDYCFRIGGVRKFFVEAKKPAIDIKVDASPAYQLRRYAWSAKLPLSILTDFEEIAVYDCRVKPAENDKASTARTLYLRYDELPERWHELASIFSRDAILRGAFDRYADSAKKKRGTAEVDDAFLAEIEDWRDMLARTIALRNEDLSQRDLNFAVQRTIDRIVFLRICEDRGIERYGTLQALTNGEKVYERLFELFHHADDRYNSGLFHFTREKGRADAPDDLTPSLTIDDKPLKDILRRLYYPECPYEFSVLPADILGHVYEQFLGKVIRLTPGHRAVVEEKPEVRKAGGVYYTPTYIVDYIVKQTVGALVDGRTPQDVGGLTTTFQPSKSKDVRPLAVLDPACGSGSFLLGAYQFLLDWYRDRYVESGPENHTAGKTPRLFQHGSGDYRLTTAERKRILLSHIHGVDIDPQAVEVTKLSLLLKVLEGESAENVDASLRLFRERALPDLANNIKCGNSLIAPDFYEDVQMSLFDDEQRMKINVFDWKKEFADIMQSGGFDAVIGNPPWGQKEIAKDQNIIRYLQAKYASIIGIYDLFRPFVERGVTLTRPHAIYGVVLPDVILLKDYPSTRKFLLDELALRAIDWWGMAFASAVIDAVTVVGCRVTAPPDNCVRVAVHDRDSPFRQDLLQSSFLENPRYVFNLFLTPQKREMLSHLGRFPTLGSCCEIHEGVHSGNIRSDLFVERRLDETCEELIFGRDEISPYTLQWTGRYVRLSAIPRVRSAARYANAGNPDWYRQDKLLVRRTGDYVLAAVDRDQRYASNNFFLVFPKTGSAICLDSLCALLNSRWITWYFRTIEPRKGRVFAELKIKHLETFPVPRELLTVDGSRELAALSRSRREIGEALRERRTPHAVRALQREGERLDEQIDNIVADFLELDPAIMDIAISMKIDHLQET
jgi:predicted type IV restriction endonuclease